MSESQELEQLQNRKAELQEESRSLGETKKTLETRVRVLEEKIAIKESEHNNKLVRGSIAELESKVSDLEKRLEGIPGQTENTNTFQEPLEVVAAPDEGSVEDDIIVTAVEEPMAQQEMSDGFGKQSEKKKRKLF